MSCPSDFVIDEIVAGAQRRDPHFDGCASCRERLARFERIAAAARPQVAALLLRAQAQRSAQGRHAWRFWTLGASLAAGMAAIFVLAKPAGEVRLKGGGVTVQMYRMRSGEVVRAHSGDSFVAGDALRFVVIAPRAIDYALAEVESAGKITLHQRGHLEPGATALAGSLVLDASPAPEWFVLVVDSKDPLAAIRAQEGIWLEIRK